MQVYQYDRSTGEYLNAREARISPLDAALGREVYLIPASATTAEPPTAGDNQAAVFDAGAGTWELAADYRGTVHYDPDGGTELTITALGETPAVTVAPPDGLYRPVWDQENQAWVEGEDTDTIRLTIETRIVDLRRKVSDAEGLTIQIGYQAELDAAEAELAALNAA